jgi:ABC-type oligopeptide transport system substrate-binding subunit
MRRNIVLAIATVLLVAAASAASAAPNKASTDAQNSYRVAGHQDRFKVGY